MTRADLRLLPLWVFAFILPFTHTVALRLLGLFIAFGMAAFAWIRTREPRLPFALPAWRWILFWALLPALLLAFSRDRAYSLGEIKSEIVYGLMALVATLLLVRTERNARATAVVLLAAFAVMTSWSFGSWLRLGTWNEGAYFGGTGTFSTYVVSILPLFMLAVRCRFLGRRSYIIATLFGVLGIVTGFLTAQRTFWVALAGQILVLAVFARAAGWWRVPRTVAWGAAGAGAVLALALMWAAIGARFGSGVDAQMLWTDPRVLNWERVLAWIAERPLTGFGFGRGMMEHAFPEMWGRADMFWHAHNVVLNYGFQLGIAGFVAILGLFAALLLHWWRFAGSADPILQAIGAAGALLVTGVFLRNMTNDFFQRDLSLLFWTITGLLTAWAAARRPT